MTPARSRQGGPRVGSCFSGAGGFDLGFHRAGFEIAWFCEIDPTARAVLARHWPEVPCYEDIRALDPADLPAVDVLVGGFPCQDVSVAGNRAGLAGERTGLFWEFARLVAGLRPTWLVLENVPGLLSSNGGRDMGAILWALGELGYGWAYRVLDAQWWGVAQRRERVFIVGHSGADTRRAAQVLLESDSGAWDSPPSREAWTDIEDLAKNGVGIAHALRSRQHTPGVNPPGRGGEDDFNLVVGTLSPGAHPGSYNGQDAYTGHLVAETLRANTGRNQIESNYIASTLQASAGHHGHGSPRGDGRDNQVVARCLSSRQTRLDADSQDLVLAVAENQRGELRTSDISPALSSGGGKPGSGESAAWTGSTVRRLMPIENERLQGWPDGWTEGHADTHRYRLTGNGVVAPVAEWIARRILAAHAPTPRAARP